LELHRAAGSLDPAEERVVEVEQVVALVSLEAAFDCVEDRSRLANSWPDRGFLGALQGRLDLDCCRALGSRRGVIVCLPGAEGVGKRGRSLVFKLPRLTVEEEANQGSGSLAR
jgi:hypothetical protein